MVLVIVEQPDLAGTSSDTPSGRASRASFQCQDITRNTHGTHHALHTSLELTGQAFAMGSRIATHST